MDNSIFRDFHTVDERIKLWWTILEPKLTSDTAIHVYVVVAALLAVAASLYAAYRSKNNLRELRLEAFEVRFGGRPPKHKKSIDRRIDQIRQKTREAWVGFARDFALLFFCGLIVPSAALLLLCAHYSWFDASGMAFIDLHAQKPVTQTELLPLTGFVINQVSHGALLDFPEVFNIDFGRLANNPSNFWFSGVVLLFRTIVGGFTLALAVAIRDTLMVLWKVLRMTKETIAQIQANAA